MVGAKCLELKHQTKVVIIIPKDFTTGVHMVGNIIGRLLGRSLESMLTDVSATASEDIISVVDY